MNDFASEAVSLCNKNFVLTSAKGSNTEILSFCYWHSQQVIGLRDVQFRGFRARHFISASISRFGIIRPITPWIVFHSVLLPSVLLPSRITYYHVEKISSVTSNTQGNQGNHLAESESSKFIFTKAT